MEIHPFNVHFRKKNGSLKIKELGTQQNKLKEIF